MDSSSSSNSCFSVGSTSPGAVVLLYSVGARGTRPGAGPREDSLLPVLVFSGTRPGPKEWIPTSRRRAWVIDLVSKATVYRCVCKWCMLLEVSAVMVPLVPSHSLPLFLHLALGLQKALGTGRRRGNSRHSVSGEGLSGSFWATLRNLLVFPSLRQAARGTPPHPRAAPTFLAGKYWACMWT